MAQRDKYAVQIPVRPLVYLSRRYDRCVYEARASKFSSPLGTFADGLRAYHHPAR